MRRLAIKTRRRRMTRSRRGGWQGHGRSSSTGAGAATLQHGRAPWSLFIPYLERSGTLRGRRRRWRRALAEVGRAGRHRGRPRAGGEGHYADVGGALCCASSATVHPSPAAHVLFADGLEPILRAHGLVAAIMGAMELRPLGRTGLSVPPSATARGGSAARCGSAPTTRESLRALHRAIDLGVNFIDTALGYGMGHSETLVGKVARERKETCPTSRPRSPPRTACGRPRPTRRHRRPFPPGTWWTPVEKSLWNLERGPHRPAAAPHLAETRFLDEGDSREALERLRAEGKVRFVGISVNDHDPGIGAARGVRRGSSIPCR